MLSQISIRYDALAIEAESIKELKDSLTSVGPTKAREEYVERGGDFTSLWLLVSFVGASVGKIVIDELVGQQIRTIVRSVKNTFRKEEQIPFTTLVIQADDTDIHLNIPINASVGFLSALGESIAKEVGKDPLKSLPRIDKIILPLAREEGIWSLHFPKKDSINEYRFWGIQYSSTVDYVFDSKTRTVTELLMDDYE